MSSRKRTGGKEMFLKCTQPLVEALAPLGRDSEYVLLTAYGQPFSEKSLTGMMQHWCRRAGIPASCVRQPLRTHSTISTRPIG